MPITGSSRNVAKATDDLMISADTVRNSNDTAYTKKKEIKVNFSGTFRVVFDLFRDGTTYTVYGQIYKNGVAVGTERSTQSTTPITFTEDLNFNAGDLIQLYCKTAQITCNYNCQNFRIKSDLVESVVGLD